MTDPVHTYHVIIPHPDGSRILLSDGAGAQPTLPHIASTQYIDWNVADLNAVLRERFGLTVTTLRRLQVNYNRETKIEEGVFLVEAHPPIPPAADGLRWVEIADPIIAESKETALRGWLAEQTDGTHPPLRAPWARPGWFAETCQWIAEQLDRLGIEPVGLPIQRRNWSLTAMIVQPTEIGDVYVKATNAMFGPEGQVTQMLSELYSDHIPPVLAQDSARRLLMMRDFGGVRLEDDHDEAHSEAVVRTYGRIQREMAAHVDDLLRTGCWDRRPDRLAAIVDDLLADTAPLRLDQRGGLTGEDYVRIKALGPRLKAQCARLADFKIPASLVHGDFHGMNIVVCDGDRPVYFDWSDAQVGHPFIDIISLFEEQGSEPRGPEWADFTRRMQSAYLEEWSGFEPPDRLQEALQAVVPVAILNMAISYRHIYHQTEEAARDELGGATAFWLRKLLDQAPES